MMERLTGSGVSPGIAIGTVYVLPARDKVLAGSKGAVEELDSFEQAVVRARDQLCAIATTLRCDGHLDEAGIIDAQILMLEDPSFIETVRQRIRAGEAAARALQAVADELKMLFADVESPYVAARAADVQDIANRISRNLGSSSQHHWDGPRWLPSSLSTTQFILVAHDLTPSETASLDRARVLGFALDTGSATSHTAILARALNIPAVVGLHDITARVQTGDELILDGEAGMVVLRPSPAEKSQYSGRRAHTLERWCQLATPRNKPAQTYDGRRIVLAANIGSLADLSIVQETGAEGVGLFRTEFLFAERDRMPTEEEQ
jgi:phosphotransferase system enzyme I (PtsI)